MTDHTPSRIRLHIRHNRNNPNHHLWNNNGMWWMHFSLKNEFGLVRRMRISLKTIDLEKARNRRDRILADISAAKFVTV